MTTYRILILRTDGSITEESHDHTEIALRAYNLTHQEADVDAVRIFDDHGTNIATVSKPLPPRHTVKTRLQMYAQRLDADAALGFTRD